LPFSLAQTLALNMLSETSSLSVKINQKAVANAEQ
jgi:hypothetical protein